MATITPQTAAFKALVEDVFGAPSTAPDALPPLALTERQIYRETVASVAARAKAVMDAAVHGRIDKAEALVLAGDVELLADGTARVGSQTSGSTQYLVNGVCACKDARALDGWCKHRLGAAIARRTAQAIALAEERMAHDAPVPEATASGCFVPLDPEGTPCQAVHAACPGHSALPQAALPEAAASVNVRILVHGREVQWTLRSNHEAELAVRLDALLARYPLPAAATVQPIAPAATAPREAEVLTPSCPEHGPLRESTKAPGTFFCPARREDDAYCTVRYPAKAGRAARR